MVVLVAVMEALDDKGDEIERECQKVVPIILEDPGVVNFAVHRAVDDPNKFLFYECYENLEALMSVHKHFKVFNLAIMGMFAEGAEITRYNTI